MPCVAGGRLQVATSVPNISPASARQLSEEARRAYVVQRNVGQAFDLQLRAFGANPRDPDVAGNLAFLFLRANPTQAETARQLALHAIALRPSQLRAPLADDWSTLAIASALTGREADATNALYVVVALSRDLDRNCRAALGAVDRHGDIMGAPVQAMMLRIRQHDRRRGVAELCVAGQFANGARVLARERAPAPARDGARSARAASQRFLHADRTPPDSPPTRRVRAQWNRHHSNRCPPGPARR